MMVIEDKDSSYATFYRTVSEHKVSISSSLLGKDGLPKKFHTNDRENLANDLLLHNMDINKLLVAISRLDAALYKQIIAVQKIFLLNQLQTKTKNVDQSGYTTNFW